MTRPLLLALVALASVTPACSLLGGDGPPGEADRALGEVVWSYPSDAPLGQNDVRPVIDGTAAGGGTAYVAHARQLDAVALADGEVRWSTPVPSSNPYPIVSSALLDFGDRLVLNDFDEVHAFDKATGRRLWRTRVPDYAGLEHVVLGRDDGHVYLPGLGEVVQIAVADGAITRRFRLPPDPEADDGERLARHPLVHRGVLYAPDSRGPTHGARYGDVVAFSLQTGEVLWDRTLPVYHFRLEGHPDSLRAQTTAYGAAAAGDRVVVATEVALHALDAATGDLVWSAPHVEEGGFAYPPQVADGAVYVGGTARWLYKHDLATGAELWRYRVRGSFTPLVAVDGGRVYATDDAYGEVHVVDAATGERLWAGWPPNGGRSGEGYISPVAVGGGRMVVASDRAVYGLAVPPE